MSLLELFCNVDDFWQKFEPIWHNRLLASGRSQRIRPSQLCESEVMTILIHFHECDYKHFKAYYMQQVRKHLRSEFPKAVSYQRFVKLAERVGLAMYVYAHTCLGDCTGVSFIDSTSLPVCRNRRIYQHRVFEGLAERGKSSMGWFYGFKLHLIVNEFGEVIAFDLTRGNVHDTQVLEHLKQGLFGKLIGDKGYLSKSLFEDLFTESIELVTRVRRNMRQMLISLENKILLNKRGIIESVNNLLKNWAQIDHTRHRSPNNFFVNTLAGLVAYCWKPHKPSARLDEREQALLAGLPALP